MGQAASLEIAPALRRFVEDEALPGTGLDPAAFWRSLADIVRELAPRNAALLAQRDALRARIDSWHQAHPAAPGWTPSPMPPSCARSVICTPNRRRFESLPGAWTRRIATVAGPQLVVPVNNARYALNAANARWGSLYDALYGTDAIPRRARRGRLRSGAWRAGDRPREAGARRGGAARGGHACPRRAAYAVGPDGLVATVGGRQTGLADPAQFAGYRGRQGAPGTRCCCAGTACTSSCISTAQAGSAATTPPACPTSCWGKRAHHHPGLRGQPSRRWMPRTRSASYRNWLGLMRGDLEETFEKGGRRLTRRLNPDRDWTTPSGGTLTLPGRALMLVRNVGHHMMTDMATLDGDPVPETILDAMITASIALHDLRGARRNSRAGSVYIVKPKMHGPDEVAWADAAVRPGRGRARPRAQHAEDGHHGRGTAHHAEPQGLHRRRQRPDRLHQHRLPRSHRRRDPHLDGGRRHGAQERHATRSLDTRLRGLERRYRPRMRPRRPGRRSARACGRRRTRWRTCWRRRARTRRPAPAPPGCPRPRRRRCTRCTTSTPTSSAASARSPPAAGGRRVGRC